MDKKPQILVVDDESGVAESFCMILKDSYKVSTTDCGKACLEALKEQQPQLVILDVRLPDINGIELLKEIKRTETSLPVIVITGVGTHKTAIEALKFGADDFIAKPLNFNYVRSTIARSLAMKINDRKNLPTSEDIIIKNYLSSLQTLNKILEARDPYTLEHSKMVSKISVKIARQLGLSKDEQEVLQETALLHDIGKMGVSDLILNKPDKLNAQEWAELKRHPQIGEEFLEPLQVLHIEQSMVRHHHERHDGRGYPDHLKGEQIPLYARILAVADAYGAMVSQRPYRRALTPLEAITELERCSGTQFDPQIVKAFVEMIKEDKKLLKVKPVDSLTVKK